MCVEQSREGWFGNKIKRQYNWLLDIINQINDRRLHGKVVSINYFEVSVICKEQEEGWFKLFFLPIFRRVDKRNIFYHYNFKY